MMENAEKSTDRSAPPPLVRVRYATYFAATLLMLTVLGGGYFAFRDMPARPGPGLSGVEEQGSQGLPPIGQSAPDYRKWGRPDLALILSGQMHGYVDPCGCSRPQFGGLVRRYNFINSLRANAGNKKGWDLVGIDLGEIPALKGIHAQNLLKYELSIRALTAMNYRAVGIGKDELQLPLGEGLAQIHDANRPMPRPISTTLAKVAPGQLYHELNARPYEIIADTSPKVGIICLIGPDLREQNKNNFLNNLVEVPKALKAFADAGVEIGIILHHEYPKVPGAGIAAAMAVLKQRKESALNCAQFCADERKKNPKIPPIHLVMVLTDEAEPPFQMHRLDPNLPTQLVEIGHKGKYVGLVGIFRHKKAGFLLEYQPILMSEDWETKAANKPNQPVIKAMERYNQQLKQQDMLAKYPRTMHYNQLPPEGEKGLKANYVGSQRCNNCHPDAFAVWKKTWHFKATQTLEDEKFPSGRQFDPECMMCHTVGFKHTGGYHNPPADVNLDKHNSKLRGVGCESCHGPGSAHVATPKAQDIHKLINPYGPSDEERKLEEKARLKNIQAPEKLRLAQLLKSRLTSMEQSCIQCHDQENDVNWKDDTGIFHKWISKQTIHRTPPKPGNGNPPPNAVDPPLELKIEPGTVPIPQIKIEVLPEKKK